ncbi:hypothetical protein [Nitrospira sp. BLG_1]|uniref:hypothetical protein n=1 Tax=Nitrospira sp. BLG_1 TaxID=3395883 RepID=UPI0039BCDFA2
MSGIDFDIFSSDKDVAVADDPKPKAQKTSLSQTDRPDDSLDSQPEDVTSKIANVLAPNFDDEDGAEDSAPAEDKKADSKKSDKTTQQPVIHNENLLRLAESWGIGPDDASRYATEEALLGAVAIRELRWRRSAESRTKSGTEGTEDAQKAKPDPSEPVFPEIKFDEDTDPAIKAAIEKIGGYAKQLKDYSDKKIGAMQQAYEGLQAEHEQAAEENTRSAEAKIAQMFDEKVKSWGPEFVDLIGVPQETWTKPGTDQHKELTKLRNFVLRSKAGYETLTGKKATVADLESFVEEGRHAIWPDKAHKIARDTVASQLKKQKGGVGLRTGRNVANDKPAQGDGAAKNAVSDLLASFGVKPYAKQK